MNDVSAGWLILVGVWLFIILLIVLGDYYAEETAEWLVAFMEDEEE